MSKATAAIHQKETYVHERERVMNERRSKIFSCLCVFAIKVFCVDLMKDSFNLFF